MCLTSPGFPFSISIGGSFVLESFFPKEITNARIDSDNKIIFMIPLISFGQN
jgi:hypothetical protein